MTVSIYKPVFVDLVAAAASAHRRAMHAGHALPSDALP